MATVVAAILSVLLLLQFLNCPVHNGIGGLLPVAMERTLKISTSSSPPPRTSRTRSGQFLRLLERYALSME